MEDYAMRTTTVAGLAAAAALVAISWSTAAGALPIEPSAISKANAATSNVVDVQWRRRHRYWGPRYGYWGPRPYPYYSYGYPYGRYYGPSPYFSIGPRGFGFGVW
jgi:hypothetical protein